MFLGRNSDSCRGRWIGQKWLSNIWNAPTSHGASFETEIRESACTPIPFVINESVHFITKYNSLQNNKKWRMDISQSSCHFHIYFYPIQTGSFFHFLLLRRWLINKCGTCHLQVHQVFISEDERVSHVLMKQWCTQPASHFKVTLGYLKYSLLANSMNGVKTVPSNQKNVPFV